APATSFDPEQNPSPKKNICVEDGRRKCPRRIRKSSFKPVESDQVQIGPRTSLWDREKSVQWGMSNVLKVSLQTTIYSLAERGWSQRRIASELGINRETVGRYWRLAKPAISTGGAAEGAAAKPAISITGKQAREEESKPAISIAGITPGRRS